MATEEEVGERRKKEGGERGRRGCRTREQELRNLQRALDHVVGVGVLEKRQNLVLLCQGCHHERLPLRRRLLARRRKMRRKRTGGAGRGGGSREHARLTADKHTRVSTGAGARAAGAAGKQQQTSWRHFSTTLEENFWRESWMML